MFNKLCFSTFIFRHTYSKEDSRPKKCFFLIIKLPDRSIAVFSLATSPIGNAATPLDQAWLNLAVLNQGTQFIDLRDFRILIYVHPKKNFTLTALIGGWVNLYMREYFLVLIPNSCHVNGNIRSQEVAAHYGFSRC